MDWKGFKYLAASAIGLVVATQAVRKLYKRLSTKDVSTSIDLSFLASCNFMKKTYELNDVIIFTDTYIIRRNLGNRELNICDRRDYNYDKLIKYIDATKQTLDICMNAIASKEIADNIIKLGQKHVLVRVIVEGNTAFIQNSQIRRFLQYSFIRVQCHKTNTLMHHKFCVVDGPIAIQRKNKIIACIECLNLRIKGKSNGIKHKTVKSSKGFVMSGSVNWSTEALDEQCHSIIVTSQPQLIEKFENEFNNLWVDHDLNQLTRQLRELTLTNNANRNVPT